MLKMRGFRAAGSLKNSFLFSLLAFLIIFCVAFTAGCGQTKKEVSPAEITITDSLGRSVSVPQPLEKVVVLNGDVAEALSIIGVRDAIIGISDTVQQNPYLGLQDKPVVGKWDNPSVEKIVELKPQVVLTYSKWPGGELEQKLEPAGVKVVRLDFFKPETYDKDLLALARMFVKVRQAEDFIKWKAEKVAMLSKNLQDLPNEKKVRVFAIWESNLSKETWKTFGQGSAVDQCIKMAGGNNIAGSLESYPQVNAEWILKENPAFVAVGVSEGKGLGYTVADFNQAKAIREEAFQNGVLRATEAVKEGRVCLIHTKLFGSDKTYIGALYLAKWLYPERFKDVNPDRVLKEYFDKWLHVPFKGRWAYPESTESLR
ncbi:MAG: ABC transporter substrate-binding protein [Bacillota bacterium]